MSIPHSVASLHNALGKFDMSHVKGHYLDLTGKHVFPSGCIFFENI